MNENRWQLGNWVTYKHLAWLASIFVPVTTNWLLTLIIPRGWEIGSKQPCIKCQKNSATQFVCFWSRKTLPYTHLEQPSYIPQQGQSLHIWTTSPSTTDCYKISTLYNFYQCSVLGDRLVAILSGETELALGIRVNKSSDCLSFQFWNVMILHRTDQYQDTTV